MEARTIWNENLNEWEADLGIKYYFYFESFKKWNGVACKGFVSTTSDRSKAESSQFYNGEIIDCNENYLLWQNDVYYSVLNRKTGVLTTMNLEDDIWESDISNPVEDEDNPINAIWKMVK